MSNATDRLRELATLYGVQLMYHDVSGREQHASPEALLRVTRALGANLERMDDAHDAVRARRQELWRRRLEPVHLAWDGGPSEAVVRIRADQEGQPLHCTLTRESGETQAWTSNPTHLPANEHTEVEGVWYQSRRLYLPGGLPTGYHRLAVEHAGGRSDALVIAAPTRAYEAPGRAADWGVFLPLYALHSTRSCGAGDFTDLEALANWVGSQGGGMVATLPLLAAFLDEPFEPGPYSPASRLFWNEFYLDLARIPELERAPAARRRLESPAYRTACADLNSQPLVDYRRQVALKREILEELARTFFADPGPRQEAFRQYLADNPRAEDYAAFRATGERHKAPWPTWPERQRGGELRPEDYDLEAKRYHLYVQWQASEQLERLAARARSAGSGFYLDLPLGVNPDSYDVWRERSAFATGMAAGAPPDPFFAKGQNWGFPPMHPERVREDGYRYVIGYLRHHMRLAGVLRIDHVMGLHRLFWVPHDMGAREGVYVTYPAEELYAVFSLESHRHQSMLVGEDLGTVPEAVRPAMQRHNVHRMYVMQYELQPHHHNALVPTYAGSIASLNTHDMPPFAAFWEGLDVKERVDLNILDQGVADEGLRRRREQVQALVRSLQLEGRIEEGADLKTVLRACLTYMPSGQARVVLCNLEDLWLETKPQNVPGTWRECPNWRRRAKLSLEAMQADPDVRATLHALNQAVQVRQSSSS